jgi:hypothetical protein
LSQLTNDPGWLTLVRNQATTLMASGTPRDKRRDTGTSLANAVEQPEWGEFFLGLFAATKDRSYLAFAGASRPI